MKYVAQVNGKQRTVEIDRIDQSYRVTMDGKSFVVDAFRPAAQSLSMLIDGQTFEVGLAKKGNAFSVYFYNDTIELELMDSRKFQAQVAVRHAGSAGPTKVHAPMPGKIVKVAVQEKSAVEEGDSLLIIEAMKMQNELKAPVSGTVAKVHVKEGEAVSMTQVLMVLE